MEMEQETCPPLLNKESGAHQRMIRYRLLMGDDSAASGSSKDEDDDGDDQAIVWQMLQHAAHETSLDDVQSNALLQPYAHDFGRTRGDVGVVAFVQQGAVRRENGAAAIDVMNVPVGAAWVRVFEQGGLATAKLNNEHHHSLKGLPELAVACLPEYRGKGVGSCLLKMLLQHVQQRGQFSGVCLSCRRENTVAMKLYERIGFVEISGSEQINRTGGTSISMVYNFEGRNQLLDTDT